MSLESRPFRSVLYMPASNERALEKARELPTDALIFDLEDAVAPDAKSGARDTLARFLAEDGYGSRTKIVRINALATEWGPQDVAALGGAGADAILIPKVGAASDVDAVADMLDPAMPIWVMMETPASVFNAREIAAHARVGGLVAGTNDLAKDIGCRSVPDRTPLMHCLQTIVLAARAARGVVAIDGVYNKFRDEDGLKAECAQGRDLGYDGKTLIHPAQIGVANEAFSPDEAEVDLARRQIEAFEECQAGGGGVAVVDGQIVENLHVVTARRILERAAVADGGASAE